MYRQAAAPTAAAGRSVLDRANHFLLGTARTSLGSDSAPPADARIRWAGPHFVEELYARLSARGPSGLLWANDRRRAARAAPSPLVGPGCRRRRRAC